MSVSDCIYEGFSLNMLFLFNHLLPKCLWLELGQASVMTFSQLPKYPCDKGGEYCRMPLKRPFLLLARIQWHLVVVVDTFLLKTEDIPLHPFLFSFVLLWTQNIMICLEFFKFYLTDFPVKCIINIKYREAMFAGHFYSYETVLIATF